MRRRRRRRERTSAPCQVDSPHRRLAGSEAISRSTLLIPICEATGHCCNTRYKLKLKAALMGLSPTSEKCTCTFASFGRTTMTHGLQEELDFNITELNITSIRSMSYQIFKSIVLVVSEPYILNFFQTNVNSSLPVFLRSKVSIYNI